MLIKNKVAYVVHKKTKFVLFFSLICVTNAVNAVEICVSWNNATQREDGTALNSADLSGVVLEYYYFLGDRKITRKTTILKGTSKCLEIKTKGVHNFVGYTVDSNGIYSKPSAEVSKVIL